MKRQYLYTNQTVKYQSHKASLKGITVCNKKEWEMFRFRKYILKGAALSTLRKNTSFNTVDVKNSNVEDNTEA